jgi:hypothetical protein
MIRKVICPHCGLSSDFDGVEIHCQACAKDFGVNERDFQNVKFLESNDGYHCWQAQPTAYHIIYACLSYPEQCEACIHNGGVFCRGGKIDFRMPVTTVIG